MVIMVNSARALFFDLAIEYVDLAIKFFQSSILYAILQIRNNLLCQTHSQLKQ
jgi:hypothetical protein